MKRLVVIFTCLLLVFSAGAQSVDELKKRKARALKNLETTSKLVTANKKNTENTLNKINLISAEIEERSVVIKSLTAEMNDVNRQISSLNAEIASMEQRLSDLKAEYANLLYHQYYKRGKWDALLFVLSADNVTQAFRRYNYITQYSSYCVKKGEEIKAVQLELNEKHKELEGVRSEKTEILTDRRAESQKLQSEKEKQNKLVSDLKKKDKELRKQLKKQQAIADKLNAQIEKKIAEEAAKAAKAAQAKAKSSGGGAKDYALTKEEKLISGNFENNRGRLPWPVEHGVIVGHYGVHPHPVLEHVTVNNKGIYIQSPKGTRARAVYDGEVTQCFSIPGSNNVVIIKHGLYRTVYAGLSVVNVKVGDKVKTKQTIGVIYTDPDEDNKTELNFQVWKDKSTQDPEVWLAK